MYKNWPISSNWPSNHKQYLLIGKFDSLHHSVSSVDYKSIVLKELQSIDKPFIEGGCCFYLNYLLNSKKE
jgi:tRNA dimethylallyltransferase